MARYVLVLFILLCTLSLGISVGLLMFAANWSDARAGFLRDARGLINGLATLTLGVFLLVNRRKR